MVRSTSLDLDIIYVTVGEWMFGGSATVCLLTPFVTPCLFDKLSAGCVAYVVCRVLYYSYLSGERR